ncbi:MAG: hypothetical protein ABEK01_01570, partial [Candidatus Nanohaloarchaea archaeon]
MSEYSDHVKDLVNDREESYLLGLKKRKIREEMTWDRIESSLRDISSEVEEELEDMGADYDREEIRRNGKLAGVRFDATIRDGEIEFQASEKEAARRPPRRGPRGFLMPARGEVQRGKIEMRYRTETGEEDQTDLHEKMARRMKKITEELDLSEGFSGDPGESSGLRRIQ